MSHGQSPNSTANFSGRGPETLERIYQQLNLKISDLTDENRIQKVALTELASINSALLARCKALEIENANLWNEVFKVNSWALPFCLLNKYQYSHCETSLEDPYSPAKSPTFSSTFYTTTVNPSLPAASSAKIGSQRADTTFSHQSPSKNPSPSVIQTFEI